MEFLNKHWVPLALVMIVIALMLRKRSIVGQQSLVAPTGTYVPGTEEPPVASDGLTHQVGETTGPAVAARSGRGHF